MLVTPRTPSGFPEYLPNEQIEFNRLLDIIRSTYERYGFSPLDTPDVELSEVLLAKSGGDTAKQVYRFTKGDTDLSLRFDLTVPLARYVAQHQSDLVFPFRRYQIGKVHRGERAQAGRFREFYQCDIDIIGSKSPSVDAEFPAIINEIFDEFNFGEFTIRINNRKVLNGFFESLGLADKSTETLRLVDKMEKLDRAELVQEFTNLGLSDTHVERLLSFVMIEGDNQAIIEQLKHLTVDSALFGEGVEELEALVTTLRQMGVPENRFQVDLKIARGLDYYTGTVYETVLNKHPGIGSVCSGGRYDDLAGLYTDRELPGVGISIGLTRLFYKLREAGIIQSTSHSPAAVVVLPLSEEQVAYGYEIAGLLRQQGINVVHYTEPNAAKAKFRYADRMGFAYALVIGETEANDQTISLKNMATGEAEVIGKQDIAARLLSHLNS